MIWRYVFAALGLLFSVILVGTGIYVHFNPPSRIPRGSSALRTTPIPANGPQGQSATSSQRVAYPADWPSELRYPAELSLAMASSRPVDRGTEWTAVLDYRGEPTAAVEAVDRYFAGRGWRITRSGTPQGATVLELARDEASTGFVRVEAGAEANEARVVSAVVLPRR